MKVFREIFDLNKELDRLRKDKLKISFVATMGALHMGHMGLINKAKEYADIVICSIFVNPTQFNNDSDLEKYPRQEKDDLNLLESAGCDIVFMPTVDEIYPKDHEANVIDFDGLDKVMEGANRPGHFDGVVEIVSRFFEIIKPDFAFFGEKDFQQLAVIKHMCKELDFDIEIIGVEIIRKESGLAMSSRNQRLSKDGEKRGTILHDTLTEVQKMKSKHSPQHIKDWVTTVFEDAKNVDLEYFEISEIDKLAPIDKWEKDVIARAFIVAWVEGVRLIDNVGLSSF